jgi:hypothetical protein
MTSESRTLIEPHDILGIECECTHCKVKHLIPLQSFDRGIPVECPNCHERWLQSDDEAKTITYFVRCLKEVDTLAAKNAKQNERMRIRFQVAIVVFLCVLIVSVPARAQERSLGAIGVGDEDIRIVEIIRGSPAERAGLAIGDILTTSDGDPSWSRMSSAKFELTTSKEPGSRLLISYLREGKQGMPHSLCPHQQNLR